MLIGKNILLGQEKERAKRSRKFLLNFYLFPHRKKSKLERLIMKLKSIKQEVYHLTSTKNTKQFSKKYSHLTKGKDLRDKSHWLDILEQIRLLREQSLDISLKDLEDSEKMLKESLFTVGKMAGLNEDKLEIDWQRIQDLNDSESI